MIKFSFPCGSYWKFYHKRFLCYLRFIYALIFLIQNYCCGQFLLNPSGFLSFFSLLFKLNPFGIGYCCDCEFRFMVKISENLSEIKSHHGYTLATIRKGQHHISRAQSWKDWIWLAPGANPVWCGAIHVESLRDWLLCILWVRFMVKDQGGIYRRLDLIKR